MNRAHHVAVNGIKGIRKLLQSEKGRFAAAPILLIQGTNDDVGGGKKLLCAKQVHFLLAQQLGLRTVVSNSLGLSAFPTTELVQQQVDLCARVGAATICAVGSDAAMHLAKATAQLQQMDELILIPATYSAVLATTPERSLLVDTKEETLVPDKPTNNKGSMPSVTIARPDATMLDLTDKEATNEAAFAVLAFCLAREHQGESFNDEIITQLQSFLSLTRADKPGEALQPLATSLQLVGQDMNWGFGQRGRRDVSLAIAVSLLPKIFPTSRTTSIMASHAPTLFINGGNNNADTRLAPLYQDLVELLGEPNALVCNQSVDTLLGVVRENQAAWNCLDVRKQVMTLCLSAHSLVD